MKIFGKLQEAFCTRHAKCRTLGLTIGLAIPAIVASPAQGQTGGSAAAINRQHQ